MAHIAERTKFQVLDVLVLDGLSDWLNDEWLLLGGDPSLCG